MASLVGHWQWVWLGGAGVILLVRVIDFIIKITSTTSVQLVWFTVQYSTVHTWYEYSTQVGHLGL